MTADWARCDEKMPPEGKPVIGWFYNGGYPVWAYHHKGEWCAELGMHTLVFQDYQITHWAELEPPEASHDL